ncbi:1-acyl-sn-glycerol-3-phosphate acyltransferase [Brasilonema sp. UFV-L1]|uniref:lysophospholipid acyltransferase family protein n=1 Tax=Brasilonema sp. UFV-L1 TaxID=2234130 RepID=UPI00145C439F|nr:1-acyl-sn-glycerol-3-phosphate acyltransferase [Brasilonema sp. UFV-L1]NMG07625.1 1-acyl-sn-glycerol-3-phosphate acyltransferase [Brasilonema sp. UFV-L1]
MIELNSSSDTSCNDPATTTENTKVAHIRTSEISPWLSPVVYFLGGHVVLPFFFGRIKVTGQENLPKTGPVILAPTHRARWDSLLLPYAAGRCVTGRDLRFMVTITECQGLQGWFVRRLGGFSVDPQRPSITTLRHSVELLEQAEMLVIFPEGGIFRDRKVQPLKPGIARLALSAQSNHPGLDIKIVPVGINYSEPYPTWGTDVSIHIGSSIKVADYAKGSLKQDAKRLTGDLAIALQKLSYQELEITPRAFAEIANS